MASAELGRRVEKVVEYALAGYGDPFDGLPDPDPGNTVTRWGRHWYGGFNPGCRDGRASDSWPEACTSGSLRRSAPDPTPETGASKDAPVCGLDVTRASG